MAVKEDLIIELKSKGLTVLDYGERCVIIKPVEASGNKIRGWNSFISANEYHSDCPSLDIYLPERKILHPDGMWRVRQWKWVPGPGPGDFSLPFKTLKETCDFVFNYFFENNQYFNQIKEYVENEFRGDK